MVPSTATIIAVLAFSSGFVIFTTDGRSGSAEPVSAQSHATATAAAPRNLDVFMDGVFLVGTILLAKRFGDRFDDGLRRAIGVEEAPMGFNLTTLFGLKGRVEGLEIDERHFRTLK